MTTTEKAEQCRESLKSNISKYGTPIDEMENILRGYATDKDTLNGLCEEYLNNEDYKNEVFDIVMLRLENAVLEKGIINSVVLNLIDSMEDEVVIKYAQSWEDALSE